MHIQVVGAALAGCWAPTARALCGGGLLAASQHAAGLQQHMLLKQQQYHHDAWSSQQQQPQHSTAHRSLHSSVFATTFLCPAQQRSALLHTSSQTASSADQPQQQQQQDGAGSSNNNEQQHKESSSSSSSSSGERINVQHEAQEASKGFLAKSLDMEELWFSAVVGRLKVWSARTHPDLKDKEQDIVDRVQEAYYETLLRAAAGHLLSNRSRNQLKQACLAAATYKVLMDSVPGCDADAEQFIADLMGGLYAPFMLGGLKLSSWVKRLLLRQSSVSQAVDTLHTIARDMEGACHCSVQPLCCGSDSEADDAATTATTAPAADAQQQQQQQQQEQREQEEFDLAQEHEREDEAEAKAAAEAAAQHHSQQQWQLGASLTVDSCLYAEVLKGEGVPQLLKTFCCQHNMSWLDTYSSQGVNSRLEACIAKGDGCCRITVAPADGAASA